MKIETGESKPYERVRIPDETYIASFKGAREVKDGKFGKRVALIFEVDYDGKIIELARLVYLKKATPKNELGSVILALGGKVDGKEVELDSFVGTKCRVVVDDYEYEVDGVKKMASTINKVKPLSQKT